MSAATLDAALRGARAIVIDTSVWVAFLTTTDATHPLARHLFGRIAADDDPLRAELSMITAAESMVRPARTGTAEVARMRAYLGGFPNLTLVPVDLDVATTAAEVRGRTNLRLPDALVVATALARGADAVTTNDDAWCPRLTPVYPQLRCIELSTHA